MNAIRVVDHDPSWPACFEAERGRLAGTLGAGLLEIQHVGSTSVPGLAAKPKIDIDAVLRSGELLAGAIALLTKDQSYAYHGDPYGDRMWTFTISRGSHGVRLYLCEPGNQTHVRRILFRDWLRGHDEDAAEYAALKLRLAREACGDWKAYTGGKSAFVSRIVKAAAGQVAAAGTLIPRESTSAR
jgi:GrpB-like predicted nucleotidyltransferase (UPF0157 family)